MTDDTGERLILAARDAARNAYAPYSHFTVGAALLLNDGSVVSGANVENASYGLSLCAETVAVATASAAGRIREIVAVGIVGGMNGEGEEAVLPCGRCRQILNEAAELNRGDMTVYCSGLSGGAIEVYKLSDLLPRAFGPRALGAK
jgi:cytidine deaminase